VGHRIAPRAEDDLDAIWLFVAKESGSLDTATRLIDSLTDRFLLLAGFPSVGRRRDAEFGIGIRSFPVGEYLIFYCVEEADVLVLRVLHGKRELGNI
jgi:toxin ParE1/3/4